MAKGGIKTGIGAFKQISLDGNEITVSAADINRGALKKATGTLTANDDAGKVFSWKNPEGADVLIEHVALVVSAASTGVCTIDVGTTAVSATTSSDTLIDGVDVSAIGIFTNDESAGTNGKPFKRLVKDKWVTASKASGASAGLKGTYEIYYRVL